MIDTPQQRPSPNRRSARQWSPAKRAFTLAELIAVMLIVVIMLAMAAPSLSGFYAGRETDHAAGQLIALAQWARAAAVTEARPFRLNVDEKERAFWITAQDGGAFKAPGQSFGQRVDLPAGVEARWIEPAAAMRDGFVQFDMTGAAELTTIRLLGRRGVIVDVTCEGPTEPFRAVARHDVEEQTP